MQTSGETIIAKLNAKLAIFRRDRDDALRRKELAIERLRIVVKDRENAERQVREIRQQLLKLQEENSRKVSQVDSVEKEVEQLTKEHKFQHSELTGKKEKLSRLDSKRNEESLTRQLSISSTREALRKRRESTSHREASNCSIISHTALVLTCEENKRKLRNLTEADGGEELLTILPDLIGSHTERIKEETSMVEQECILLRRKIAGYRDSLHRDGCA